MENKIYVNGPHNFFKLKNSKINKTIYLFFDVHLKYEEQTSCGIANSENIDKFLNDYFKNATQKTDFLLEIYENKEETKTIIQNTNNNYIEQVRKLYIQNKNINANVNVNAFQNVRFHFIDIRFDNTLEFIYNTMVNIIDHINKNELFNFDYVIEQMILIKNKYIIILEIINNFQNNNNVVLNTNVNVNTNTNVNINANEQDSNIILQKNLYKIISRYNDPSVQRIIMQFFEIFCVNKIKYTIQTIDENINRYEKYDLNNINKYFYEISTYGENENKIVDLHNDIFYHDVLCEIKKDMNILQRFIYYVEMSIMDTYFLRRFLDKTYINNVISYTGGFHASTYLWILVKYFDFEIIEYDFINFDTDKNKFVEIIKNSNDMFDIMKYVFPLHKKQCILIKPLTFT